MAEAKFWIMPRTGTALKPVDSTATGVTATKGFDLARDLIGGLPDLDDQIGGLQSFDVQFQDNRNPHAATPARVGAGTVFSRSIIDARPDNAAPWRVEIEYAPGNTVSFDVQFGYRKTIPAGTISAELSFELEFKPTGDVT